MAEARSSRPLRRGFGLASILVASADIAAVGASSSGDVARPALVAGAAADLPLIAYGCLLLVVGVWSVATSFAVERKTPADAVDDGNDGVQQRAVLHALRDRGWDVIDDLRLTHVDVDHVAVGPAGVLAVQVQWTTRSDSRGKPAARARLASQQLHKRFAAKELSVDVVPVVLSFGPGLDAGDHVVEVVDTVVVLNAYCAPQWMAELDTRSLLPGSVVEAVRSTIDELSGGDPSTTRRSLQNAVGGRS